MDVIQIGILGVAGALLAVQFKSGKTEYGIYISLALSLFIFFCGGKPVKDPGGSSGPDRGLHTDG